MFFRLLAIAKKGQLLEARATQERLKPYYEPSMRRDQQLMLMLDMMRTVWGDPVELPAAVGSPWPRSWVLPNTPDVRNR